MSSPYYLEYDKYLIITNPVDRTPLPKGLLRVAYDFLIDSLKTINCSLHQYEPLQVTDKVGFLKTGDDAAALVLDGLEQYVKIQIASGGKGLVTLQDLADALHQQGINDATTSSP